MSNEEEVVEGWSIGSLYPEPLSSEEVQELDTKAEAYLNEHPGYQSMDEVSKAEVREFTKSWVIVTTLIKEAYDNELPLHLSVSQTKTLAQALVAIRQIPAQNEDDEEE